MRRGKVIGLSVCQSVRWSIYWSVVTKKIARSWDLGIWATHKRIQSVEISENWLEYALLAIIATPIDRAHLH